jgi:hypothetical protein
MTQYTRQSESDHHHDAPREEVPLHRLTATEMIDGVRHLLVLEQDATGHYQEVQLEPMRSRRDSGLLAAQ